MTDRALKIDVIVGSKSDRPQVLQGLEMLEANPGVSLVVHVISCHRNPMALQRYAFWCRADVVIAAAGLAAQLPGILKTQLIALQHYRAVPVIGVGLRGRTPRQNLAATLSIEELPGKPVVLDERGKAYFGGRGFVSACERSLTLPRTTIGGKPENREEVEKVFSLLPPDNPPPGKEAILFWDWREET